MKFAPGDLVIVLAKLDSKIREKDKEVLTIGTYQGTLRIEGIECYVLLDGGDIVCCLHRELQKV